MGARKVTAILITQALGVMHLENVVCYNYVLTLLSSGGLRSSSTSGGEVGDMDEDGGADEDNAG